MWRCWPHSFVQFDFAGIDTTATFQVMLSCCCDVIEIKCYSGQLLALDSLQIWFDIGFVSSLTSWCWNSSVFFVWMQLVIGEPLGKGSSGQLYRGKYMSQDVAIKMIALVDGHNVDMDSDSLQACPASERLQTFKQEFSIMRWALYNNCNETDCCGLPSGILELQLQ